MGTLYWYITRRYLAMLALCLGGLITVYLAIDCFEKLRVFLRHDAAAASILWYFVFKMPAVVFQFTPFAVLMASILTIGLLNTHHELTAMRSCGMSLLRVTMPFLVIGGVATVLLLGLAAVVVPLANARADYIHTVDIRHQPRSPSFKADNLWLRLPDRSMMHVQRIDPDGARLHRVEIYRIGGNGIGGNEVGGDRIGDNGIGGDQIDRRVRLYESVAAASADFTDGHWSLRDVVRRSVDPDGLMRNTRLPSLPLHLSLTPDDLHTRMDVAPEHMTLSRLGRHIARLQDEGHATAKLLTDYWGRVALACVPLLMTVLGLSIGLLGINTRAPGMAGGIGWALGVGFAFWATHLFGIGLGRSGALLPVVAAWIACLMFLFVGLNLLLKVRY